MGQHHNHHSQQHHHNSAADDGDGVSQRVISPRFSGPMTRRAQSFKRNNNGNNSQNNQSGSGLGNSSGNSSLSNHSHHEISVLNSPRSEVNGTVVSSDLFESFVEKKQSRLSKLTQRVHLKKNIGSFNVDFGLGLELKGKRKLGHWMFFVFCGACLFLGVLKFCVSGWFGSTIERVGSNQVGFLFFPVNICYMVMN